MTLSSNAFLLIKHWTREASFNTPGHYNGLKSVTWWLLLAFQRRWPVISASHRCLHISQIDLLRRWRRDKTVALLVASSVPKRITAAREVSPSLCGKHCLRS